MFNLGTLRLWSCTCGTCGAPLVGFATHFRTIPVHFGDTSAAAPQLFLCMSAPDMAASAEHKAAGTTQPDTALRMEPGASGMASTSAASSALSYLASFIRTSPEVSVLEEQMHAQIGATQLFQMCLQRQQLPESRACCAPTSVHQRRAACCARPATRMGIRPLLCAAADAGCTTRVRFSRAL